MKTTLMLIGALLISSTSIASDLTKNSANMQALRSAWKIQPTMHTSANDITMVYGGEDISRKPTLAFHTATA
ncbi:MAG: hypothetical protein ACYC0J_07940 [Gammaproteobacteria bacterium]